MEEIRNTTQEHLDIETITKDLVILKNGAAVIVLKTTAVNFDLLSEIEQDAIIAAYSALINSLNFPIQIVIRSKRLDITNYLDKVQAIEDKLRDPLLKVQANAYKKFVQELIKRNEVLDKSFFIAISSLGNLSLQKSISGPFSFLYKLKGGDSNKKLNVDINDSITTAINDLYPKRDSVIRELARINIKSKQLNTQELVELFFDIYNPISIHEQKIRTSIDDYTVPLVEPAILEE